MTTLVLVIIVIVSTILILISLFTKANSKERQKENSDQLYVLNVVTNHSNGKQSSHWHGCSTNRWKFTYDEAKLEKQRIKNLFDEVEILEYKVEQKTTSDKATSVEDMKIGERDNNVNIG